MMKKKKVCVSLGAGALAVTRQTRWEDSRAWQAMTENGFYVIYSQAVVAQTRAPGPSARDKKTLPLARC